jgi:Leucine-rich repeat (LRR) protein
MNRFDRLTLVLSSHNPIQKLPNIVLTKKETQRFLTDQAMYRQVTACASDIYLDDSFHKNFVLRDSKFPLEFMSFVASHLNLLDLKGAQISDLSTLGDLPRLTSLNLSNTRVADFGERPLRERIPNLMFLYLSGSRMRSLEGLVGLAQLHYLELANTEISDLTPLENLDSLKFVNLENCRVETLEKLPRNPGLIVHLLRMNMTTQRQLAALIMNMKDEGVLRGMTLVKHNALHVIADREQKHIGTIESPNRPSLSQINSNLNVFVINEGMGWVVEARVGIPREMRFF